MPSGHGRTHSSGSGNLDVDEEDEEQGPAHQSTSQDSQEEPDLETLPLFERWYLNAVRARRSLNASLLTGTLGTVLDLSNTFLSLGHCGVFAARTYYEFDESESAGETKRLLEDVGLGISCFLASDFLVRLTASESWISFLRTRYAFVELLTIIPPLALTAQVRAVGGETGKPDSIRWVFQQMIFFRFLRIYKLMKFFSQSGGNAGEVQRQVISVLLTLLTIIFLFGCLFYVCESYMVDPEEKKNQWGVSDLVFHDAMYFSIVTVTTVGYGEFRPLSWLGKILVIITVAVTIIVIPAQTNQLLALLSLQSPYARAKYKVKGKVKHVLVCGHITANKARDFCQEFFHEDHGMSDAHIVFLCPELPDGQMEMLAHSRSHQITYLQGSALVEFDLARAEAVKCEAVILLCDNLCAGAQLEDSGTILRALAMSKYLNLQNGGSSHKIPIIMELRQPGSKHHFLSSAFGDASSSTIICMDEIRLNLIAKSCLCPGFCTLISNLVMSSSIEVDDDAPAWVREYSAGCGLEIYRTALSPRFRQKRFVEVAQLVFEEMGCTIFAVEVPFEDGRVKNGKKSRILINPADYVIVNKNTYVFALADDQAQADKISVWNLEKKEARAFERTKTSGTDDNSNDLPVSRLPSSSRRNSTLLQRFDSALGLTKRRDSTLSQVHQEPDMFLEYDSEKLLNLRRNVVAMNQTPATLSERERQSLSDMEGHVIICGTSAALYHFIATLRPKHLPNHLKIVIIDPDFSAYHWDTQVAFFNDVYYVRGQASKPQDLLRAGVMGASRAVILSPSAAAESKDGKIDERGLDTSVVFIYQAISMANPNIHIVCEMVSPGSVPFLCIEKHATKRTGDPDFDDLMFSTPFQQPYVTGNVYYFSKVMDLLACQAFFNSHLITILQELVVLNPETANVTDPSLRPSELFTQPIPQKYNGRTYGDLFRHLTRHGTIPLGLYRRFDQDEPKRGQPDVRYVVTAPEEDLELRGDDHMYVLHIPGASDAYQQETDDFPAGRMPPLAADMGSMTVHRMLQPMEPSDTMAAAGSPLGAMSPGMARYRRPTVKPGSAAERDMMVYDIFATIKEVDEACSLGEGVGNGELRSLRDELRAMLKADED